MSFTLAQYAYMVGGAIIGLHLLLWLNADAMRDALSAFPRCVWPGRLLVIFDFTWIVWVVVHADLGRFTFLQPYVYIAGPLVALICIFLLDDLLAPRMLGGLLLLIGNPILNAARWHESPFRFVLILLVYAWAIEGIVLLLSPYRFRKAAAFWMATTLRWQVLSVGGLLLGALILVLGLTVY